MRSVAQTTETLLARSIFFPQCADRQGKRIWASEKMLHYLALCPGWTPTGTQAIIDTRRVIILRALYHTPSRGRKDLAYIHLHQLYAQLFQGPGLPDSFDPEGLVFPTLLSYFLKAILEQLLGSLA